MDTITIQPASPKELAGVTRLARRIISQHYRPFYGEERVNDMIDSGEVDRAIQSKSIDDINVVLMQETVIGLSICEEDQIERFVIEPSFQRMGLGSQLLAYCEAHMFTKHQELYTTIYHENTKATSFFEKHGWRPCERQAPPQQVVLCKLR